VLTARGERRAQVSLGRFWINTGTLCNLACSNCYIESTPRNDRLAYITAEEVRTYLDEIESDGLGTELTTPSSAGHQLRRTAVASFSTPRLTVPVGHENLGAWLSLGRFPITGAFFPEVDHGKAKGRRPPPRVPLKLATSM